MSTETNVTPSSLAITERLEALEKSVKRLSAENAMLQELLRQMPQMTFRLLAAGIAEQSARLAERFTPREQIEIKQVPDEDAENENTFTVMLVDGQVRFYLMSNGQLKEQDLSRLNLTPVHEFLRARNAKDGDRFKLNIYRFVDKAQASDHAE